MEMNGRQCRNFTCGIAGQRHHHRAINLVLTQLRNTFGPFVFRFAHRYPDVGIDEVRAFTPVATSSVSVILPPFFCASALHSATRLSSGQQARARPDADPVRLTQRLPAWNAHIVAGIAGVDQHHLIKRFYSGRCSSHRELNPPAIRVGEIRC